MKSTSFIRKSAVALAAMGVISAAQAQSTSLNPYETIEGSVSLKGTGIDRGVSYSDVKVAAKLTRQASGAKVTIPNKGSVGLNGSVGKAEKLTNKEILAAAGVTDTKGVTIRWTSIGGKSLLQAFNKKSGIVVKLIDPSVLSVDPTWITSAAGLYAGTATLTATPTVSGTSVYISEGKLSGLTSVKGTALGYIPFSGVGKYKGDSKKGYSTSSIKVAGLGELPPATK